MFLRLRLILKDGKRLKCKLIEEDAEYLHIDFSIFDSLSFNGQYFTVILGQLTAQEKLINDLIARVEALEK